MTVFSLYVALVCLAAVAACKLGNGYSPWVAHCPVKITNDKNRNLSLGGSQQRDTKIGAGFERSNAV